jgi:hypothetical protein
VTDAGGNVPAWVDPGSYQLTAASQGSFTGAVINFEAVRGDAVTNIAADAIGTAQIQDGAVTTSKIAAKAVTEAQIADGAVGTDEIADGSVTPAKLNLGPPPPGLVVVEVDSTSDHEPPYVAEAGQLIIVTGHEALTILLPSAPANSIIAVCNELTREDQVWIYPASGAEIFGRGFVSAPFLVGRKATVTLQSDGTNWHVISGGLDSGWHPFTFLHPWCGNNDDSLPCGARLLDDIMYLRGSIRNIEVAGIIAEQLELFEWPTFMLPPVRQITLPLVITTYGLPVQYIHTVGILTTLGRIILADPFPSLATIAFDTVSLPIGAFS